MYSLKQIGIESISDQLTGIDQSAIGRISKVHKERYEILSEQGILIAEVTGNLRFSAQGPEDFPVVGDWVEFSLFDELAIIHRILSRKSLLKRKAIGDRSETQPIASNIEYAFIICAANYDFNLNRIERYLVMARSGNIIPVVLLSKTDLISQDKLDEMVESIQKRMKGIAIIPFSNESQEGIEEIIHLIKPGETICLLGSSGVGKSTLINNLLGVQLQKTKKISDSTHKGMHTTTGREMIIMENGGILIDTPGMREVGISNDEEGIDSTFSQINSLAGNCRYHDCKHINEPGCVVLEAIKNGILDESAYENYQKLVRESEHYESSVAEKRKKDKAFGKMVKNVMKQKKKGKY